MRGLALAIALACAWLCLGCDAHLVGTNDVRFEYRVEPAPKDVDAVANAVKARLAAAQISATLDPLGADRVAITVDRGAEESVEELLAWRGGIDVYDVDSDTPEKGPLPVAEALDAVTKAQPSGKRALVQGVDGGKARVVTVHAEPLASLRDEIASVDSVGGHTLHVHLRPSGVEKLEALHREGARVAFARARSALAVRALRSEADLAFDFGEDIYAYARAHRARQLLRSPSLPALVRASLAPMPVNAPLAVSCLVVPMLLSFAWIFFVRRFDRAHPEPMWLVLATFALGGLSVIPAGLAEYTLMRATPYLNPTLMTLGGQVIAFPAALAVFTLVVGVSEELSKLLGAWTLAYHRREFDEPVDGIVYGAISSLGFAAVENIKYFTVGRLSAIVIIERTFMSIPAHMFFGAIWGYAMGRKLVKRRTSIALFLGLAALLHGAFDTFLSIDGMAGLALVLNLGLASTFVLLLRRALRHGVMTAEAARAAAGTRVLYEMGSRAGFVVSAIAMHVVAALVLILGAYIEVQYGRVGLFFVEAMTSLLVVLIVTAYFLSKAMPLDVALDDYGVTFAGASRAWRTVVGVERRGRAVLLRTTDGDVTLGPGAPDVVASLAGAIAARMPPVV